MRKAISIFLSLIIYSQVYAQADETMAHFRSFSFMANTSVDSRMTTASIVSLVDANVLKGRLHLGGHFAYQIYRPKEDATIGSRPLVFWYNNPGKKENGYEINIGFNYFQLMQEDVKLAATRGSGNWSIDTKEPGSRAFNFGIQAGFGASNSNSGGNYAFAGLKNSQGFVIPAEGQLLDKKYYKTTAFVNNNYFFIGSHNYFCKKFEDDYDNLKGGRLYDIYVDMILPISIAMSDVIDNNGNILTPILKTGAKLKKIGYRVGFNCKGSNKYGLNLRLEGGTMPNFANGSISQSIFNYGALGVGVHITPLIGLFELRTND